VIRAAWLAGLLLASGALAPGAARAENEAGKPRPPAEPRAPAAPRPVTPLDLAAERVAADRIIPHQAEPVTEETKREVERLVAGYFKAVNVPEPAGEARARIGKLIGELGSEEWAVRENASTELVRLGVAALGALRAALKSADPEVISRAGEAVSAIEAAGVKPITEALRKYPQTVWVVVQGQINLTREAWSQANAAAAAAEKAGRKDEAGRLRAEAKALGERISDLDRLYWQVQNYTRYDR